MNIVLLKLTIKPMTGIDLKLFLQLNIVGKDYFQAIN